MCGPQLAVNLLTEENYFAAETACNLQQSDIRSFFLLGSIPIFFSFLVLGHIVEIASQVESFSVCTQSLSLGRVSVVEWSGSWDLGQNPPYPTINTQPF